MLVTVVVCVSLIYMVNGQGLWTMTHHTAPFLNSPTQPVLDNLNYPLRFEKLETEYDYPMFPQYRFRPPPPNPVFGIQSPPTFTYTKPSEIYPPGLPIIGPKGSQHRLAYASYRSGNLMESDGVKARRTDPLYAGYPYLGGYGNGEISLDAILSRIPDIAEKIIKSENFEKMPTTTSTPWVDVLGVKSKGLIKSEPANVLNSMPDQQGLLSLNKLLSDITGKAI